jgi:phage shock protein A
VGPLLFMVFWFWVVVAGLKGVVGSVARWLCTPWGNNDDHYPTLRGSAGQAWSSDEYRHYSSLAAQSPVPAIPDVMQGMQQALSQEKRTAEQLGHDIAEWQHAIEQLNRAVDTWTEKAATALAAGRNDLARAAIAERQRTQQRIKELESDVVEMRRLLTTHASDIQDLEAKLSTVYRRNHLAETRLTAAETSARAREMLYGEQIKDALSRFEELERAADLAEGRADALKIGSGTTGDDLGIDAQLAALPVPSAGFGRKRAAS